MTKYSNLPFKPVTPYQDIDDPEWLSDDDSQDASEDLDTLEALHEKLDYLIEKLDNLYTNLNLNAGIQHLPTSQSRQPLKPSIPSTSLKETPKIAKTEMPL